MTVFGIGDCSPNIVLATPSHDEIARRQAVILLRRFLPRPNKSLGHGAMYRRRILGDEDFRLIRGWLAQFEAGESFLRAVDLVGEQGDGKAEPWP